MLPTDMRSRANPQPNIPGPQPTADNPNTDPRLGNTTVSSTVDPYSQPLFFPSFHAPNQTRIQFGQLVGISNQATSQSNGAPLRAPGGVGARTAVPVFVDSTSRLKSGGVAHPHRNVFEAWQRQRQLLTGGGAATSADNAKPHHFVRDSNIFQRDQLPLHQASATFNRHHHFPVDSDDGPSGSGGGNKSELEVSWRMLKTTFDRFFDDQIQGCGTGASSGGSGGFSSQQLYTAVFTTLSNFLGAQLYNTVHRYMLWRVLHLRDCLLGGAFARKRASESSSATSAAGTKRVRTDDESFSPQNFKADDFEILTPVVECDNIHLDSIEFTAVGKVTDWAPGLSELDKVESFITAHFIFHQAVNRMGSILLHLNHNYCSRNNCRSTDEMAALAFAQHFILTPSFTNHSIITGDVVETDSCRDILSEMGVLEGVDPRLDDLWEVFGRGTGTSSPSRNRQYNPISQCLLGCVSDALHVRRSPTFNTATFDQTKLASMKQLVEIVFGIDVRKAGSEKEAQRIQYGVVSKLWCSGGQEQQCDVSPPPSTLYAAAATSSSSSHQTTTTTTLAAAAIQQYISHHAENDSCVALLLAVPFIVNSAYHSLQEALFSLLGVEGARSVFEAAARGGKGGGGGAAASSKTALSSRQHAVETLFHTLPRSIDLAEYAEHLRVWHDKEDSIQQLFTTDAYCMVRELEDPLLPYLLLPRYLQPASLSLTGNMSPASFPLTYENTPGSMYYLLATRQLAKLKSISFVCQRMGEGKRFQAHLEVLLNALGSGILFGGVGMIGGKDGAPQKIDDPVTDLMLRAAAGLYVGEHMNDIGVAWLAEQLQNFAGMSKKGAATTTTSATNRPTTTSSVLLYLSPQSNPLGSTAHIGTSSLSEASLSGGSLPLPSHSLPSLAFLEQLYVGEDINNNNTVKDGKQQTNRLSTIEAIACFYVLCQSLLSEDWTVRTVVHTNHPLASNHHTNANSNNSTGATGTSLSSSPVEEHVVSMFVFKDSSRLLSPAAVDNRTLGGPQYEASHHHHMIVTAVKRSLRVVFNRDSSLPIMFNHSLDWLVSVANHGDEALQQHQYQNHSNLSGGVSLNKLTFEDAAHFSMKLSKLIHFWSTIVFDLYISLEEGEPFEVAFYQFLSQRLLRRYRGALMSVASLEESTGYMQQVDQLMGRSSTSSGSMVGGAESSSEQSVHRSTPTTASPSRSPRLQNSTYNALPRLLSTEQDTFDGSPPRPGFPRTRDDNDAEEDDEGVDGGAQLGLQPNTTLSSTNTQGLSGLANSSHEAVFIRLLRFFVGTTVTSKIDSMFGDCKASEEINREFRRRFGVVPPIAVRTCWVTEVSNSRTSTVPVIPFLSSTLLSTTPTTTSPTATPAATITPHTLVPLQYDVVAFAMGETQSSDVLNYEDTSSNPYRKKEAVTTTASSSSSAVGAAYLMATPLLQQLVSSPVLPHALSVSILTKGLWPAFPTSSDIMLPVAATRTFQVFKKYYLTKYTNRRLELCKRLGTFEISMCVPSSPLTVSATGGGGGTPSSRTYNLLVPTQCAPVLMLFDDALGGGGGTSGSDAKTIHMLSQLTNQSEQEVMAVVTACVDGLRSTAGGGPTSNSTTPTTSSGPERASIFKLGGSTRTKSGALALTSSTTVEFNCNFYHPSLDIGIGFVTPPLLTGASYSSQLLPNKSTNTSSLSATMGARSSSSLAAASSSSGGGGGMLGSGAGGSTDGGEGSGGSGGGPARSIALDRNRRTQVSVTIVRLLKKESPMPHSVLLEWTQSILLHHFSLTVEDFKREVETLIGKQFVARVEGASVPSYKYTA